MGCHCLLWFYSRSLQNSLLKCFGKTSLHLMKYYFSPSKYAFWLQCYLEKTLLVINIKGILPHCKLVLYPRMVSGLSLKTSIILLNKICVFVDNLVCFLLCLCCDFLLEFATSSFLFMETLHIKVGILLILGNITFPISELIFVCKLSTVLASGKERRTMLSLKGRAYEIGAKW